MDDFASQLQEIIKNLYCKEAAGELRNSDFTEAWKIIVLLPISRFRYMIEVSAQKGYDKDNAVLFGLLNRIRSYLEFERMLVNAELINEEILSVISRILLEDNITFQYYLRHKDKLSDFRRSSIKGEIKFEEIIKEKREKRSEPDQVMNDYEDKLLASIQSAYQIADYNGSGRLPSLPTIKTMAMDVGLEEFYITYRMECHSTHSDWFNLTRNYLIQGENEKFYPRFDVREADIRKLNPMLQICYKTIQDSIDIMPDLDLPDGFSYEIDQDLVFIQAFDYLHFN